MHSLTIPLFPATRHARLSVAHAAALFGERTFEVVHRLASGDDASDCVVSVDIGAGRLEDVRVLLPFVDRSSVAVTSRDARALGLAAPLLATPTGSPGCTLHGPEGVVVLGEAVVAAEHVELPAGPMGQMPMADVVIDGERPRTFRRLPVVCGPVARAFVLDDLDAPAAHGRLASSAQRSPT
jgi:propanediol utilization protein